MNVDRQAGGGETMDAAPRRTTWNVEEVPDLFDDVDTVDDKFPDDVAKPPTKRHQRSSLWLSRQNSTGSLLTVTAPSAQFPTEPGNIGNISTSSITVPLSRGVEQILSKHRKKTMLMKQESTGSLLGVTYPCASFSPHPELLQGVESRPASAIRIEGNKIRTKPAPNPGRWLAKQHSDTALFSVSPPFTPPGASPLFPDSPTPVPPSRPQSVSIGVRQKFKTLSKSINRRSESVMKLIARPPTPEEDEIPPEEDIDPDSLKVEDFVPDLDMVTVGPKGNQEKCRWVRYKNSTISTTSALYITWVTIVSLAFGYNAFCAPFRASYPYQTADNLWLWFIFDYLCDIIYWLDMALVKPKLRFMKGGIEIRDITETRKHYFMCSTFKLDLLSILPTDLLYFHPRLRYNSLLRFNRLFKQPTYMELQKYLDSRLSSPYALRIAQTLTNMLFLIHCNSCIYYKLSEWQWPSPDNRYIYHEGDANAYIFCFYYATKLAISVGNCQMPGNVVEYAYTIFGWLMGVFVFAILLGSIRDIVGNATKTKDHYRNCMDNTLEQLKKLNVNKATMDKVRLWYVHTWEQLGTFNERKLIEKLPKKLQADLAISAHYKTLGKVKLFQGCDRALIRDVVLKLQPVLFLPGDYVCRKGEIGKEMYIISSGMVEVVGGPDNNTVFASLVSGSVFGEISLLAERGNNRRTADVRSKGFSFLFVLSKQDLDTTIRDYPEAQQLLKKKAWRLKKETKKRNEKPDSTREQLEEASKLNKEPRMADAVLKLMKSRADVIKKWADVAVSARRKSTMKIVRSPLVEEDEGN